MAPINGGVHINPASRWSCDGVGQHGNHRETETEVQAEKGACLEARGQADRLALLEVHAPPVGVVSPQECSHQRVTPNSIDSAFGCVDSVEKNGLEAPL